MDFQCMKRRQLQALCKKHGVSANLSNREMADSLSLLFKKNKREESAVEKSRKKVRENGCKVVKKVTFSPENETFNYEVSGYKRGGRRSTSRKRARKDVKNDDVEAKTDVEKKNVRGRGLKKAKNEVSEDDSGGRITRSHASDSGPVQEESGNEDARKGKGKGKRRGGSAILAGDGAEQGNVPRKTRGNVTRNVESESEMLIESSKEVELFTRKTRSQAKIASEEETVSLEEPLKKRRVGRRTLAVDAKAVATKDGDSKMSTVEHEEPSKDVGRFASRRKSVATVEIEGFQEKKQTRKSSRNSNTNTNVQVEAVGKASGPSRRTRHSTVTLELETHQTAEETGKRTRNSKTKLEAASTLEAIEESSKESDQVVKATAAKDEESEMCSVEHGEPSKDVGRYASRRKSVVAQKGEVEIEGIQDKKQTRKSSRNNNSIVKVEAVGKTSKQIDKVENVTGPSRRTRRNTILFASSVSTDGVVETHQTAQQTRKRTRNSKTKLGAASRLEAIEESDKESDKAVNVSLPSGLSRRTRRNTIMFPSSVSTEGEVETHQPVRVEDGCSSCKGHLRRSSRTASRSNSILTNSTTEGIASGVGKGKQQKKQRQKQIIDEDISTSKCKPLAGNPPRRYSHVASKSDLVKPAGPANKLAGKKRHSRSRMPVIEESPERTSASKEPLIEDVGLAIGEKAERATNNLDTSGSKQVSEGSNKKKPYRGQFQATVNLDIKEATNTTTNFEEASPAHQVDNLTEPSNILAWEKAIEAEEPSMGKNINDGNDNADDHSNKDDRTSVEEHQTLVNSEDAEANVEMQENAAQSNLGIGESSERRTEETQLIINGGNATKVPSRPALETEGLDNEVNNDPDHTLIANNVDSKEGACNTEAQNVFQSTELERGNTHSIEEEESSSIGMDSDKFICKGESAVSNAWDGDNVAADDNQPEETFYNERTSQVLCEKIAEEDYNVDLQVGDSAITGSVKRNDGDTRDKEKDDSELYAQDAVETANEVSEKNPYNFSGKNRGRCMHEPLEAEENYLIITEERGSDVIKDTSVARIDLQSPSAGDKGICPELALMENELINDEHETVSGIGAEKLSSFRARLSVHKDMVDKLKSELNEDTMDVLMAEVQTKPSSHALQNSMENDTQDASNSSCKVLCQPIGDCSSEGSRTEALDSDLVGEKSSSVATREIDREADFKLCADVQEKNLEGALKVELEKNVDNLETKDIDGKGFDGGESDAEECADLVKEENADCVLEVEFGGKNDLERMAPQVNDCTGASLKEIIFKESQFSDDKGVEIMIAPSECVDRIDMLKMEESTLKNRNSDAVVVDVGASSLLIANHRVEIEGADVDDSSIQNGEITTDKEAGTKTVKKLQGEVDNGGMSAGASPIIPGKALDDKFTEINAATSGAWSEIISAPCEDTEEQSVEVLVPEQHVDEVKFDNIKDSGEENVRQLERNCFVTSDSNDTGTDRKANNEMIASESYFNYNRSDGVKEDNIDAIPQISANDIDDHLLEVEFDKASDSHHNAMLDDAGEAFAFENVEDGTEWVQKTPTFSQSIKNRRKESMKSSAEGKCYVDSSSDKPKVGSNYAAVSHSMVMPSLGVTQNKSLELHDDLHQLTSPEVNVILKVTKQVEVEKSTGGNLEANLITRDREEALEVKEKLSDEPVNQQVNEKQLGEQEHQLHLTISDEALQITQDLVNVVEAKDSITTNVQVYQQGTETQLGELGSHQSHLFVSDEVLEVTQYREDALEVKENVTTDEHITKKQLVEQENQSHVPVSNEPFHDDEETNEQNGQSESNQECNDNDFHKDSSYVSAEKVILKDATQTSGSNVDDSDMFNVEHGSHDSRKADILVDSAVYSASGSKGVAADEEVNIEGAKAMDMLDEVLNAGAWLPIMPVEQCTDQENPEEASPGIAGTVLQKIFSSSSGSEEKNVSENRLFSEYEFPASSSVANLHDLSFCNEIQIKDSYYSAGGEMVDDDRAKNHRDVALLFQEDKDSAVGKSEATENFSVENNRTVTREVIKEQLGEDEGNRKDATCLDIGEASNQAPSDNKSKSYVVEADELSCIGDGVVTAGNSKEIADFDSLAGVSSLAPDMVVDCSDDSAVFDFSSSELKVEPDILTAREINLFTGPGKQEELENSDAGALETCLIRHNSGEVNENVQTLEQVAPQVTEQVQSSEHKTTEEVAKFKSDFVERSNEQEREHDMKHGTPNHKNSQNESLKLKRIDSAHSRAAADPWRWELDLLSAQKKSPDVKSVNNFSFAKKTNSSMKMNSSVMKQSNRSSLIQMTPKQFVHDMKENVLGTKRDLSSTTAHKPASLRRALEDIRKN